MFIVLPMKAYRQFPPLLYRFKYPFYFASPPRKCYKSLPERPSLVHTLFSSETDTAHGTPQPGARGAWIRILAQASLTPTSPYIPCILRVSGNLSLLAMMPPRILEL